MLTPIIILIVLSSPLAIAYLHSKLRSKPLDIKKFSSWGLGAAFLFFFLGHVMKADGMVDMLPPWIPFRLALVYSTGLLELAVGIALFIPRYQPSAAQLAIVIFVVFFPANIYAAFNGVGLGGHQLGPSYLLIRGPLQLILIMWAYLLCFKGLNKAAIQKSPR